MILTAHSFFLHHDAKQSARMSPYSPLSTLICSAMLRDKGHDVALFDATFASDVRAFEAALARHRPWLVAIMEDNFNFLTKMCTRTRAQDCAAMIAAARRLGCKVVVNGPDCADRPQFYLDAGADAVLLGEGEAALMDIVEVWDKDRAAGLDGVAGLVLAGAHGVRHTAIRPHLRGLDKLPLPAWDLVDSGAYASAWRDRHGRFSWNIATSRGCPYACNWCAKPVFGRGYEQRSALAVAEEVAQLRGTIAPDHLWFCDDIFGLTPGWLREFSAHVNRLDARTPFMMQSRVNLMRPDAVAALAEAGCEEVWLGVESGSQKILDAMEKGARVDEVRMATRALKAAGIRACWFIQLGYPGEGWEDISLTRDLIRAESPHDIGVSVAYPLPGTRFHAMVKAQLGSRRNWEDSDELAMLFEGTYGTDFYRMVRDALHEDVRRGHFDDCRWARLGHEGSRHRSANPVLLATGS